MPLKSGYSQLAIAGLLALVTVLSCWIAYQPSQLYFFGDTWDILADLVEGGMPAIWHLHNEHFVPIPKFLLYLQYLLFGMNNYPYQIVNILIHAANTVLLYLFSSHFASNTVARVFGVLFFSLSGVYWEVTMWETTQQISLAVLFLLLSLILFDTYVQEREGRWLVWCVVSACAASLSMGFGLLAVPLLACAAVVFGGQRTESIKLLGQTGLLVLSVLLVYTLLRTVLSHAGGVDRQTILQNFTAVPALIVWVAVGVWRGMIVPNFSPAGPLTLALVFCCIVVARARRIPWSRMRLLMLPGVWILGAYLLAGFGRLQGGVGYAASSRYQYLPMAALALVVVWLADIACEGIQSRFSALRAALSAAVLLSLVVHAGHGYQLIRATSPRINWGREAHHFVETIIFRKHTREVPPGMVVVEPDLYLPLALYPFKFPLRRALSLYAAAGGGPDAVCAIPLNRFLEHPGLRALSLLQRLDPERHLEEWKRFGNVEVAPGDGSSTIRLMLPLGTSALSLDVGSCCSWQSLYTFAVSARLLKGEAHVSPRIVFKNKEGGMLQTAPADPVAGPMYQPYIVSALPPPGTSSIGIDFASVHTLLAPVTIEVKDLLLLQHPIYLPAALLSPQ